MIKKILDKIRSWFGPKYIKIVHKDPTSFEMGQLMKKNEEPVKIVKRLVYKK
jgi:hypothetical protein